MITIVITVLQGIFLIVLAYSIIKYAIRDGINASKLIDKKENETEIK